MLHESFHEPNERWFVKYCTINYWKQKTFSGKSKASSRAFRYTDEPHSGMWIRGIGNHHPQQN